MRTAYLILSLQTRGPVTMAVGFEIYSEPNPTATYRITQVVVDQCEADSYGEAARVLEERTRANPRWAQLVPLMTRSSDPEAPGVSRAGPTVRAALEEALRSLPAEGSSPSMEELTPRVQEAFNAAATRIISALARERNRKQG